jgi:hypothetical protein
LVKNFSRVNAVPKTPPQTNLMVLPQKLSEDVVNLERIDLGDRENWLRALDICRGNENQSLSILLQEIEGYQGQIDKALQSAQAQSTIYAYAIGSRLDVIEAKELFIEKGYDNLTAFIKGGEVCRPGGKSITTRQVWAYRSVTRGLNEFLRIAEAIRNGEPISNELREHLEALKSQLNRDVVESFLNSYAESIAGVLELGVSKLEQLCRLPSPVALSSLISGALPLQEEIIVVHSASFSHLRKAISTHEKKNKPATGKTEKNETDLILGNIEKLILSLDSMRLNNLQKKRLKDLKLKVENLI